MPQGPARLFNVDLSTVLIQADTVIQVEEPTPWLANLEFQASRDPSLARRLLEYNVLLGRQHGCPVESVAILLRPEADVIGLNGVWRWQRPGGQGWVELGYTVVRVWEVSVETLLAGGLWTLPLAPLGAMPQGAVPEVIRRIEERAEREASASEAGELWTATNVLLGLRYSREFAAQLMRRVRHMRESVTYQAILDEGRLDEVRQLLLRQGTRRFGPPDAETRALLAGLTERERLETLAEELVVVGSWAELRARAER